MQTTPPAFGRNGERMKIKHCIFDFDGTLFDSMSIWDSVGEIYLRSIGKRAKPSLMEEVRTMSLSQSALYMKKEYDLSQTVEEIIKGINQTLEDGYRYEIQPKQGVIFFLKQLKQSGVSMCIATSSDSELVETALKRCDMDGFFEKIFTCSEVGHGKDEPIIYQEAMKFLRADQSNTVVFEDALYALQTAKKAGFLTVGVFDSREEQQEELQKFCDCYLADFEQTDLFWKFASA